ncbi:MAG: late competence development ComFB family protein [Hydrococcus sp. C42_A2020_068]|uniref:late competence development ComFB family protein n=1 Tax=Pleurocapsa sp. PCC 7327 TaxID=118163 RepID=UPI00029FF9E2|nr:late competence development ComFB family protein [Pleurocapsa sp. PCC 7327]AFY76524.1 Late competence development protein ComFB [Pleurocapsa sp. PCC 7327]MBF2022607.1 late competence development ComFB family protein [Hydrococcus sp. C42_A2020_068]
MDSILDYLASQSERVVSQSNKNAMELLVAQEIKKQLEPCSAEIKELVNQVEVATYALNRLPSLYASSEEGLAWQKQRGQKEMQQLITATVREALEVVRKDPARFSTPLLPPERQEIQEAREALQELLDWLWMYQGEIPRNDASWRELIKIVKQIVSQAVKKEIDESETQALS